MPSYTSALVVLATVGLATCGPISSFFGKRQTETGIATVNPTGSGELGSCGNYYSDSDYAVAISNVFMQNESPSPYCGRMIQLTNTGPSTDQSIGGEGNVVTVTVQDTCGGCDEGHLDLSLAAWNSLTNNAAYSQVGISWHFCDENGNC